MKGGFFCAVWAVCLASSRCARFVRLRVKQLEACVSKLCRAACRVVVEVVVAKLDNWWRLFSGKRFLSQTGKMGLDNYRSVLKVNKAVHCGGFFVNSISITYVAIFFF